MSNHFEKYIMNKCKACYKNGMVLKLCEYCDIYFCNNCYKVLHHNCSNIKAYYDKLKMKLNQNFEKRCFECTR